MSKVLLKYIPEEALPLVGKYILKHNIHLRITKERKTKLGDFRPPLPSDVPRISVNGNLSPYQFLITLIHEIAHAITWEKHGRKAQAHGKEWKDCYADLLKEMKAMVALPEEIKGAIDKHINKPKAASCSDPELYRALHQFSSNKNSTLLENVPENELFIFRKERIFKKLKKRRSRYECLEIKSSRLYYINGLAEVEPYPL